MIIDTTQTKDDVRDIALLDACKAICWHCSNGDKPHMSLGLIEHFKEGSCSFCAAQRIRELLSPKLICSIDMNILEKHE